MEETLAEAFPALNSHFVGGDRSASEVVDRGVMSLLQPRLTTQATDELHKLQQILIGVHLGGKADERQCMFEKKELARLCRLSPLFGKTMPPRIQFFAWLLT